MTAMDTFSNNTIKISVSIKYDTRLIYITTYDTIVTIIERSKYKTLIFHIFTPDIKCL